MAESDIKTVPKLAQKAKENGLPVSEYTIRKLIRQGILTARYIGPKAVASYSALVRYFSCVDGCDNAPATEIPVAGIRRVDAG